MDDILIGYALESLVLGWILFLGGARTLEGTLASGCLISWLTPSWDAEHIKLWALLIWLASTGWLVVQVFVPEARGQL
jgi:hypothetical protein